MGIESRLRNLEKLSGYNEGSIYIILKDDDTYTVTDDGVEYHFSEKEFAEWERTKGENDWLLVVSKRQEN